MPTSSIPLRRPVAIASKGSSLRKLPSWHAYEGHHSPVLVVDRVEDERPGRSLGLALRRRDAVHHRLEHGRHPFSGLGRDVQDVGTGAADDAHDLVRPLLGLGAGQIDLVEHRDDLKVVLEGKQRVGESLRLHSLGGVDHQDRALAGGQAARDLVGEVHVARSVDEVELVLLAVVRLVVDPHGLGLDGDAALALQVHAVEHLLAHLPLGDRVGDLKDAVGQRRLAVVDVGDDGEIADMLEARHRPRILAHRLSSSALE